MTDWFMENIEIQCTCPHLFSDDGCFNRIDESGWISVDNLLNDWKLVLQSTSIQIHPLVMSDSNSRSGPPRSHNDASLASDKSCKLETWPHISSWSSPHARGEGRTSFMVHAKCKSDAEANHSKQNMKRHAPASWCPSDRLKVHPAS